MRGAACAQQSESPAVVADLDLEMRQLSGLERSAAAGVRLLRLGEERASRTLTLAGGSSTAVGTERRMQVWAMGGFFPRFRSFLPCIAAQHVHSA